MALAAEEVPAGRLGTVEEFAAVAVPPLLGPRELRHGRDGGGRRRAAAVGVLSRRGSRRSTPRESRTPAASVKGWCANHYTMGAGPLQSRCESVGPRENMLREAAGRTRCRRSPVRSLAVAVGRQTQTTALSSASRRGRGLPASLLPTSHAATPSNGLSPLGMRNVVEGLQWWCRSRTAAYSDTTAQARRRQPRSTSRAR